MFYPFLFNTRRTPGGGTGGGSTGGGSSGTGGTAPTGFNTLVCAFTPSSADATFAAFIARAGLVQKFGENPAGIYSIAASGDESGSVYPAIKMIAPKLSHGCNAGFVLPGMDGSSVNGGPPHGFFRAKVWWPSGYDFNPVLADGTRAGAGGTKFIGPWGGLIPATGNVITNPGWALRGWTGLSTNFVAPGMDIYSPRNSSGYAMTDVSRNPPGTGTTWLISDHQGAWVQLEWEVQIETVAGGTGFFKFWINGVLYNNRSGLTFMNPASWTPLVGIKGVYLQNWWGGAGFAPVQTPIYYKDIELWAP